MSSSGVDDLVEYNKEYLVEYNKEHLVEYNKEYLVEYNKEMPKIELTPLKLFERRWRDCSACNLCSTRRNIVIWRGTCPCNVLFIAEAPGACISGDTLIETAYRDKSEYLYGIPIKELVGKSGFKVFSYDHNSDSLVLGTVKRVWLTGFRKVYRVAYTWWGAPRDGKGGRKRYYGSIKVTDNHPFLLTNGTYKSIQQGLKKGNSLKPFYRHWSNQSFRFRVGLHSLKMINEARFLLEDKIGRKLEGIEEVHHDNRNPVDDSYDNLMLLSHTDHAKLHGLEDNPTFKDEHRNIHRSAISSEKYKKGQSAHQKKSLPTPEGYYNFLRTRKFGANQYNRQCRSLSSREIERNFRKKFPGHPYPPNENHKVISVTPLGVEAVYDMEVERYNNFVAEGVIVHNSEDIIGLPMVGPAGHLLDYMIERSVPKWITYAITNLVCCIPKGDDGKKTAEPDNEYIELCSVRLQEFVEICGPSMIVCVGKLSKDWLDSKYKHSIKFHKSIPQVNIIHPAAILRSNIAQQGLQVQKAIITIRNGVEDYVGVEYD